jgi:hypothetical protein
LLELDHVFCMVSDPDAAARKIEAGGWELDEGVGHGSGGTRNRRLIFPTCFFELLWIEDVDAARAGPLRQDRRADGSASPFGIALRGELEPSERRSYWLFDALGFPIWVHRDNEDHPDRPLVIVMELSAAELSSRAAVLSEAAATQPGGIREIRLFGPEAPSLPAGFTGPQVVFHPRDEQGMELVVDALGAAVSVSDTLAIHG